VLNVTRAASDVGMDERTAYDYVHLLERLFLVQRLPAWGRTLRRRTVASPKIHIVDTGVAARLLGLSADRLGRPNPTSLTEFGHLLETFAYGEVAAQGAWLDEVRTIGHWRTREGDEVDIVIEREDGGVIGIEVKAAGQTTAKDFAGLRKLRELTGDDFVVGLVLHLGQRSTRIDDDLHALPLDRLWTVDSKTS
jgi:predicted AAA+ superfamily ATPase